MPVKGRDDGNNLHDVYTTNESLSILQQAIDSGSMQGIDPSLNPVVEAIKESRANNNLTFWQGTEAEFNELGISGEILGAKIDSNGKIYVLTGDTTLSDAVTNAANAAEAAAEQVLQGMKGVVLFQSLYGLGSITLNDSISNYDYLDVFVGSGSTLENFVGIYRFPAYRSQFVATLYAHYPNASDNIRYVLTYYEPYMFSGNTISFIGGTTTVTIAEVGTTDNTTIDLNYHNVSLSGGAQIWKVIGYKIF